jgi:hypothetical protein
MRNRFQVGLILLFAATVAIGIWQAQPKPAPMITVNGTGGASKAGLLADPDVKRILEDKYKIEVTYKTLGGLASVCGLPPQDFLWPGTENSVVQFATCAKTKPKVEKLLSAPLVFYSWADVTDALVQQKWVEERNGLYYITDMPGFTQMLVKAKSWKELGLNLYGNVEVIPSDPTQSDSGGMFAALMANMLLDGKVADGTTIGPVLPDIKKYFDSLGNLPTKTGDLFDSYIVKRTPMIVAYESQLQDYVNGKQKKCDDLKQVRIIYPSPTVWASHPLIAETPNGERLQQALKDPEVQRIAWERHGFRTDLIAAAGGTVALSCFQVPASITSQMQLPKTEVMDQIVKYLGSTASPTP